MVYLLHFHDKLAEHAQHYIGSSDDVQARIERHKTGRGARIVEVFMEHDIPFELVRTWQGGKRLERILKNRHNAPRLCPICKAELKRKKDEEFKLSIKS